METAEFKITTDLEPLKSFVIESNFDEVKGWLEKNLEPYKKMAVREEDIPTAKAYRATVRKVKANLDESRKTAKKAVLATYAPFEQKCKVLTGLCDEAIESLDTQIKDYESNKRQEKAAVLEMFFKANVTEDIKDYLTFENVFDERYGNATVPLETAQKEITEKITKCKADIDLIRTMHSEFETTLLDLYRRQHDISAVVRRNTELTKLKEAEQQRHPAQAEEKKPAPETPQEPKNTTHEATANKQTYELDFRCWVTKEQISLLKQFLVANNIRYGRVPHEG